MIARLARKALAAFVSWRDGRRAERRAAVIARRIAAADPVIPALQQQIAARAKHHRQVAPLRKRLHRHVLINLAREQGRELPERIAR